MLTPEETTMTLSLWVGTSTIVCLIPSPVVSHVEVIARGGYVGGPFGVIGEYSAGLGKGD